MSADDTAARVAALEARLQLLERALDLALQRLLVVQARGLGVDCTAEIEAVRAALKTT